jgi:hypothetical protein
MKWIMLAGIIGLTTGCCCTSTTQVIAYRQVSVVPVKRVAIVPVRPVIEPVTVEYVEPVDVTTTTIDFY